MRLEAVVVHGVAVGAGGEKHRRGLERFMHGGEMERGAEAEVAEVHHRAVVQEHRRRRRVVEGCREVQRRGPVPEHSLNEIQVQCELR